MKNASAKIRIKRILFTVSILIAAFFVLRALGHPLILPLPASLRLDSACTASIRPGEPSLIADSQGKRLILLDANGKVSRVSWMDETSPVDQAISSIRYGSHFYLSGVKYDRETGLISHDRIIRIDEDARDPYVVYEIEHPSPVYRPSISGMALSGNMLYVTLCSSRPTDDGTGTRHCRVVSLDLNNASASGPSFVWDTDITDMVSVSWLPDRDALLLIDDFGGAAVKNRDGTYTVLPRDQGRFYRSVILPDDPSGSIIYNDGRKDILFDGDKTIADRILVNVLSSDGRYVYFDNLLDDRFSVYDPAAGTVQTFTSLDYSVRFAVYLWLQLLSIIYLGGLLLFLIIRAMVTAYKAGNFLFLKRVASVIAVIGIVTGISIAYSTSIVNIRNETGMNDVRVIANYFASTTSELIPADMPDTAESYDRLLEEYREYRSKYSRQQKYVDITANNDNEKDITIYKKIDNGVMVLYDSRNTVQIGSIIVDAVLTQKQFLDSQQILSDAFGKTYNSTVEISDGNGGVAGYISVESDYMSIQRKSLFTIFDITMLLITFIMAVYLFFSEGKTFLISHIKRKQMLAAGEPHPEFPMLHTIQFFVNMIPGFSAIIIVLIAQRLCAQIGYSEQVTRGLIVYPPLMTSLGTIVSGFIFRRFLVHRNYKGYTVTCAAILFFLYFILIFTMEIKNFFFFCLLTFLIAIVQGIITNVVYMIPFLAGEEDAQYEAKGQQSLGLASSSVLAALIGGLASQYFSDEAVYLCSAVMSLILLAFCVFILPRKTSLHTSGENGRIRYGIKETFRLFASPSMIAYFLFLSLPLLAIVGYKTFLFPLFYSSAGLPTSYVTGFYVLALALALLIMKPVAKAISVYDHWEYITLTVAVIGVLLLGFAINSTIYWAFIILFVIELMTTMSGATKDVLWSRHIRSIGSSPSEYSLLIRSTDQKIALLQSPLMGLLLTFGNSGACIVLGLVCVAASVIFFLMTFRSPMAKPAEEN